VIFTGEYEHAIDAQQRLAIPAEIRSRLESAGFGPVLYLVPGPNGVPWLWPERTFEVMAGSTATSLLPAEEMMEFDQLLYSQARRLEIDKVGRIRLPERTLAEASFGEAVVILGVKDHLELHDSAVWQDLRTQKLAKQAEIVLRARRALDERNLNDASGSSRDS